ncbi:3-hydroxyisobutyrate dehydrogenase [Tsukamurella ocularis]|nr:3-hydroxyisobutyrate dehydrogenase [Tsukamurella ocularis]MCS3789922.1 3-hydroxyisobutyrate dehydrogenase [Tsukamurella ocularis]MCS3852419.1 3-hydroxyisobutyrate dehydrogenase [Tsukamurella ocularis]
MGAEMAPHLRDAGHAVTVFDTAPVRREAAATAGFTVAESAAAAARGAQTIFGLVMSQDIPAAFLSAEGVLVGAAPGAVLVLCSTTTPELARQVATAAPERVAVVDAPIVGGVRYARERAITFLVGTTEYVFDRLAPLLEVVGKPVHVGDFGAGVDYKLITNVAVMAAEAGLREALDLADVLGRDYETALSLMTKGPMRAIVERALDESNPRPLRRSAEDDDTLLSAVADADEILPITTAGSKRLWDAVTVVADFEPNFVDLTRKTTSRKAFRATESN